MNKIIPFIITLILPFNTLLSQQLPYPNNLQPKYEIIKGSFQESNYVISNKVDIAINTSPYTIKGTMFYPNGIYIYNKKLISQDKKRSGYHYNKK
ncbi:hypothetical protein BDCR2A_01014 [Borrelia duttonii CR2A]|uniref:Uncharacterized protein n=1 Tax=Borrelia duttonii CR2A TaxID=1432657 RepID=W6U1E8_9SPIR|nr:hypothetical protein BDCR2A_01014 [Borrelia duttonii CR2A]